MFGGRGWFMFPGASPVAQWVKNPPAVQETQVRSLGGELRSYMPRGAARKKEKKTEDGK